MCWGQHECLLGVSEMCSSRLHLLQGLCSHCSVGSSKELEFGECSMLTTQMKHVGVCMSFCMEASEFVESG